MSDSTPESGSSKKSHTLDLSSNAARGTRPRRSTPKGFVPVVQKTINLSTPKADKPAPAEAPCRNEPPSGAHRGAQTNRGGRKGSAPRRGRTDGGGSRGPTNEAASGGTSLADLLDEATLARLRGES